MKNPTPIYRPQDIATPAYCLRYTWIGWPKRHFPALPDSEFWARLEKEWETDSLRKLDVSWKLDSIQFYFSVKPQVSPVLFTSRVKGRLQHHLRKHGTPTSFSRKFSFRAIGKNNSNEVRTYIKNQLSNEKFTDPIAKTKLEHLTISATGTEFTAPIQTGSAQYWYNLHLVLVRNGRHRCFEIEQLDLLKEAIPIIAEKKEYIIGELSIMPDHLHLALRGNISHSPEQIALSFMNNLAHVCGRRTIWSCGYYVGTFGEYNTYFLGRLRE